MTGGLIIPLMLPIMSVMIFFTVIGFWLTILPGSFYALQVIRMTYKAGKISLGTAILHGILQDGVFDRPWLNAQLQALGCAPSKG